MLPLGWLDAFAWILFFDILLNGYPVMLQRYNRMRLQRLTDRRGLRDWVSP